MQVSLQTLALMFAEPQHGNKAFTTEQIESHLLALPSWNYADAQISKRFSFKNYYATMAFVNVVAAIAHATDHHPNLSVHYGHVDVSFNTHDVEHGKGGISLNDFICAARIEVALSLT